MDRRALLGLVLGLGALWACNEHDPHPPNLTDPGDSLPSTGGGGGSSSGGTADGGRTVDAGGTVDAGECTDLVDPTTIVDENALSDNAPPGLGGTIVNGVYDLTTAQKYVGASGQAGPNGVTYREIIRITGTSFERNRTTQQTSGPSSTLNATYTLQTSATTLTLTPKCPASGAAEAFAYTVQDGRLTLVSTAGESFTYVARP